MTKTKRTVADRIRHLAACSEALAWADDYASPAKAWKDCRRGDWMLWLLGATNDSPPWSDGRKALLACALDCALTVRHLWCASEAKRMGTAVKTLQDWAAGAADLKDAKKAREELRQCWWAATAFAATAFAATAFAAAATAAAVAAAAAAFAADDDARAAADAAAGAADAAAAVAAAAAAARAETLSRCADIVRGHFPKAPDVRVPDGSVK